MINARFRHYMYVYIYVFNNNVTRKALKKTQLIK